MTAPMIVHHPAKQQPPDTFTTHQLARATGLSFRQLDYWDRTELLTPSVAAACMSGSMRLYSRDDLRMAHMLAGLLNAGMSLQRIRTALPWLRTNDTGRWLVLGKRVVICSDGELEQVVTEVGVCAVIDVRPTPQTVETTAEIPESAP